MAQPPASAALASRRATVRNRRVVDIDASSPSTTTARSRSCKRPPRRAGTAAQMLLDRRDVDGLGTLVPGLSVVRDLGTLGERLEAVRVDAAVVDEEVLASLVRCDEAEALVVVEPLDGSCSHVGSPT